MILGMDQERISECTEEPKVGVKVCVPQIMEQIVEVGKVMSQVHTAEPDW